MLCLKSLWFRVGAHLDVSSMNTSHILDEEVSRKSDELEDDSSDVDGQECRPIDSSSAEKF